MAASWYILIIIGCTKAAPEEVRMLDGGVAVADAAHLFNGQIWGYFVVIGAPCGILTSWNGFVVGSARIMFAMARAKMLPPIFRKLHPKYQTPYAVILLIGLISFMSPLLGRRALVWLIHASALGTVVCYLMVCVSFVLLRKQEPDLERPFKIRNVELSLFSSLYYTFLSQEMQAL